MEKTASELSNHKVISKTSITAPSVSDYLDFRKFLQDYYQYRRDLTAQSRRPYSYQMFSAAANIRSPNYLRMIIQGERNLSDDMILKFAKACQLNKVQTEDFHLLVSFGQATEPADRNMYLKKLNEHRVASQIKSGEIDKKSWEKVPSWIAWVLYAMIDQEGITFTTTALKKLLRGKAADSEIEEAIQSLVASGEIEVDAATGSVKKLRTLTESADDIPVALVRKIQSQLMNLGLESLYRDEPTEREFGTLTLSLTRNEFEEIKFKLRQMRKGIHKDNSIARMKSKGEQVYQLNIQLFPVTDRAEGVGTSKMLKDRLKLNFLETQADQSMDSGSTSAPTVSSLASVAANAAELFKS